MSYTTTYVAREDDSCEQKQARQQKTNVMAKNGNPGSGVTKVKGPSTRWQAGAPSRGPGLKPNVLREQRLFSKPRRHCVPTAQSLKRAFEVVSSIPGVW